MELINNLPDIVAAGLVVLGSLLGLVLALIKLFLLIPGEQPEKALRGFADLLEKVSRK